MARYRSALPQTQGRPFITDGGLETTLVFIDRIDLPCFAAFPLARGRGGPGAAARLLHALPRTGPRRGAGFVIDTPTWRANPDWGERLGYDADALADANRRSVDAVAALRDEAAQSRAGGDQRRSSARAATATASRRTMTPEEAQAYHAVQIGDPRGDGGRHGRRRDHDLCRGGDRHRARGAGARACPAPSPSPWRPTAACRRARPCGARSSGRRGHRRVGRPTT